MQMWRMVGRIQMQVYNINLNNQLAVLVKPQAHLAVSCVKKSVLLLGHIDQRKQGLLSHIVSPTTGRLCFILFLVLNPCMYACM